MSSQKYESAVLALPSYIIAQYRFFFSDQQLIQLIECITLV